MQYGILEKVAKGEVRITQRTIDILHPDHPSQRAEAIKSAADSPTLFRTLDERFPDAIPSTETLRSYLTRENFNARAIGPIVAAYTKTRAFVAKECANDFGVPREKADAESGASEEAGNSEKPASEGARVGDLIQWEIDGVLQMETPMRVRLVDEVEGRQWVAVEGSETGIPMDQVTLIERAPPPAGAPPRFAIEAPKPDEAESSMALKAGWKEERLIDDGGEEIFVRYRGEPTRDRYTFIRDYLDFKLSRMKD
jgi:hypothetical protein